MSKDTDLTNKPHFNLGRKHFNRKHYAKGITKIEKVCAYCKQTFFTDCFMPNKMYCNQSCRSKNNLELNLLKLKKIDRVAQSEIMRARKGELHPLWIKDRTTVMEKHRLRGTFEWKEWRTEVFSRDKYQCQECGIVGGKLEPHHITPLRVSFERIFDVANGITLCIHCHKKTIFKEESFQEKYFALTSL